MPQKDQKKRKKLPKDVRELETEEVARKVFGKRGADAIKKVATEQDTKEKGD